MKTYMKIFLTVFLGFVLAPGLAHAQPVGRLLALLEDAGLKPGAMTREVRGALRGERAEIAPGELPAAPALTDTGDGAESLFCLNFDRRDTRRMLHMRGSHAYVCFNFLQNPSEAVGGVLTQRGRSRCLITGLFLEGLTTADDCLVLAFCNSVVVAGSCN